jgi:hypothetical protein
VRDSAFDANAIVAMYGVVTAIERAPREVRLSVRVGTQTISVRLGPARFVDALISFAEADAVQFTGSSVVIDGQPSVLATEVTRGGKTVRLRQDDGTPLFTR